MEKARHCVKVIKSNNVQKIPQQYQEIKNCDLFKNMKIYFSKYNNFIAFQ